MPRIFIVIAVVLLASCSSMQPMPEYPSVDVVMFQQKWSEADKRGFYHTSEGSQLLPYRWFMALEQPEFNASNQLFRDSDYLASLGFLRNPLLGGGLDGLPIGFAKSAVSDHPGNMKQPYIGLTCAACHTQQLEHDGKAFHIDGGASQLDLQIFRAKLKTAIGKTYYNPFRFIRFAKRVDDREGALKLRGKLRSLIKSRSEEPQFAISYPTKNCGDYDENILIPARVGFGRSDSLGRASNTVVGHGIHKDNFCQPGLAPVSIPHLWGKWHLDWVQWNSSSQQPLGRNVAQALGSITPIQLKESGSDLFRSALEIENLHYLEELAKKLEPPQWAEVWGGTEHESRNPELFTKGQELFRDKCASCHLNKWIKLAESHNQCVRQTSFCTIREIGTDPEAARRFANRSVSLKVDDNHNLAGALGLKEDRVSLADGLEALISKATDRALSDAGISGDEARRYKGYRENYFRAPDGYKASGLEGVWATAPFLHNGSIRTLYQLLSTMEERESEFYIGSREFDPVEVGYKNKQIANGVLFKTSVTGNSNDGHLFQSDGKGPGEIGPELTRFQRMAIIEYLKFMPAPDFKKACNKATITGLPYKTNLGFCEKAL